MPILSKWNFFSLNVILQSVLCPQMPLAIAVTMAASTKFPSQSSSDLWIIPGIRCQTSLKTSWIVAKMLMLLPSAAVASMGQSPQTEDGDRELSSP